MNKWWDFTPVEFLCTRSLWLNVFFHLTIWNHKPLYMWKWLYKTTICSTAFDMKMSYWRPFMSTLNSALNSPFRILSQTDKHGIARWSRTTFIENWRNSGSVSLPIGCLFKTFVLKGPHPCLSDHNFFTYDYLSFSSHTDFSRLHNTSLISLTSLNTSITSGTYLFPMQMWRTRTAIYMLRWLLWDLTHSSLLPMDLEFFQGEDQTLLSLGHPNPSCQLHSSVQ